MRTPPAYFARLIACAARALSDQRRAHVLIDDLRLQLYPLGGAELSAIHRLDQFGLPLLPGAIHGIGADRLANAVAVAELYGSPAIVIDFGTAVTFDIVAPGNSYIGGVIAPGLEAMTNFLYHRTALLPQISRG